LLSVVPLVGIGFPLRVAVTFIRGLSVAGILSGRLSTLLRVISWRFPLLSAGLLFVLAVVAGLLIGGILLLAGSLLSSVARLLLGFILVVAIFQNSLDGVAIVRAVARHFWVGFARLFRRIPLFARPGLGRLA
jgi:hypothetical protein